MNSCCVGLREVEDGGDGACDGQLGAEVVHTVGEQVDGCEAAREE